MNKTNSCESLKVLIVDSNIKHSPEYKSRVIETKQIPNQAKQRKLLIVTLRVCKAPAFAKLLCQRVSPAAG